MSRRVDVAEARAARPRVQRDGVVVHAGGPPALLLACGLALYAGPPLETDDPDTPGPRRWEINLSSPFAIRDDARLFQPLLDINYGVGERVQLKLKPRMVVLDEPGRGAEAGAGNIQVGMKWRFLDQARAGISWSVYPQADFNPPGDSVNRGLISEGNQFFLPFQVQRTFGQTKVYAEAGYNWREQQTDEWALGLAVEHSLSQRFRLAGELRNVAGDTFGDYEFFFNAGFKWSFHKHATLLASVGRTIHETRGDGLAVFSYLGLQFTF
jgi:hypothetical protein